MQPSCSYRAKFLPIKWLSAPRIVKQLSFERLLATGLHRASVGRDPPRPAKHHEPNTRLLNALDIHINRSDI